MKIFLGNLNLFEIGQNWAIFYVKTEKTFIVVGEI